MFFFIGGIQPREITIDKNPRLCPSCGLTRAYFKRIDHYLSLFFIPVIPVKRGHTFLKCESCGDVSNESISNGHPVIKENRKRSCGNCGRAVDPNFKYCPFCGKLL